MNDRVIALRVGIVLLAAGFITGFLIILMGEGRALLQNRYTVHMRFPESPGVAVDTPVRKNGVLIGRVSHIELRDEEGAVVISARIDGERTIFKNEVPYIRSSTLLGDSVVEFVLDRTSNQPRQPYQDGDFLGNGRVATNPIDVITNLEGDVRKAMQSFETAANNVSGLSTRLQEALGTDDDQLRRLMQKSEVALDQIQRTAVALENIVADPELTANLKDSLRRLPKTFDDLQSMMLATRETLDSFKGMQQRMERNLDNIEPFTKALGERGEEFVANANKIATNIESITAIGADLAERIRNADGSLARFIRDDELYEKVLETVDNFRDASRRVRPVIDDLRVFSDKIATDPRQLGVKGALENRPVGAGFKGVPNVREHQFPWREGE
jgi:phospholipid/cholesterol/gamma-HCH transport system substrate-binding protein